MPNLGCPPPIWPCKTPAWHWKRKSPAHRRRDGDGVRRLGVCRPRVRGIQKERRGSHEFVHGHRDLHRACGGQISLHLGLQGQSATTATGCDCSSATIAQAADLIVKGDADVMFAGGADAPVHPVIVAALGASRALTDRNDEPSRASRPFDQKRDGFVMSEGAGVLVVEEMEHALQRKARIYGGVDGLGVHLRRLPMCQPEPGWDASRALRANGAGAGERRPGAGGLSECPRHVDPVGRPRGNHRRSRNRLAIRRTICRSARSRRPWGTCQGACGGVEMGACCLAIRDNVIPGDNQLRISRSRM